jgi:dTDP-4-amino-4,6-dideoxygalactose transaminase
MLGTSIMLSRGVLSLPIYPELTDDEVEYIMEKVIEYVDK